jgi:hypothetical protein
MSKSGSKSLSKSVDSVVKSVESVVSSLVPKNMNMKHILLAVLVGLLLCMMISQNVEGFAAPYATPEKGYCDNVTGNKGVQTTCVPKVEGNADVNLTADTMGGTPGDPAVIMQATTTTVSDFCTTFNNLVDFPNDAGDGCTMGTGAPLCKKSIGQTSGIISCGSLDETRCPGSPTLNVDQFVDANYGQGQMDNCGWNACDDLANKSGDVITAFESPALNDSVKRWAKCIEKAPDSTTWGTMRTVSAGTTDGSGLNQKAWDMESNIPTKWAVGSPTGKPYTGTEAATGFPGDGDLTILKPLIYNSAAGATVNAFSPEMFPETVLWNRELDKLIKFCGAPAGTDPESTAYTKEMALDDGAIIGWDSSKSKFICLNSNPAVITEVSQTRNSIIKSKGCGVKGDNCSEAQYCAGECACDSGKLGPSDSQLDTWQGACTEANALDVVLSKADRTSNEAIKKAKDVVNGLGSLIKF